MKNYILIYLRYLFVYNYGKILTTYHTTPSFFNLYVRFIWAAKIRKDNKEYRFNVKRKRIEMFYWYKAHIILFSLCRDHLYFNLPNNISHSCVDAQWHKTRESCNNSKKKKMFDLWVFYYTMKGWLLCLVHCNAGSRRLVHNT